MSDVSGNERPFAWRQVVPALAPHYEYLDWIGAGAFGDVFRARQLSTGQTVAIKVLRVPGDSASERRFIRETHACAGLRHPGVVKVLDAGGASAAARADGQVSSASPLYIVFEYVPGETLEQLLRREGMLRTRDAVSLMLQVLDALREAHEAGIIHRDLKPANIMIERTSTGLSAKILDFGVAAVLEQVANGMQTRLTQTGERLGTPAYCAPEQLRGERPSPAADYYAWGLVLLECLTGDFVHRGKSLPEVLHSQFSATPVPVPASLNGHRLGELLRWTLEKDVVRRAASAVELMQKIAALNVSDVTDSAGFLRDAGPAVRGENLITEVAALAAPRAERRPVAVLCCRVASAEGEFPSASEEEAFDEWVLDLSEVLKRVARRFGGVNAGSTGSELFFYFGLNEGEEGAAGRAGRAALEMRELCIRRANLMRTRSRWGADVRFALHQGVVTIATTSVAPPPLSAVGITAAELARCCAPGEIAVSPRAQHSLESILFVEREPANGHESGRLWFRLAAPRMESSDERRGIEHTFGREEEIRRLRELWGLGQTAPRCVILAGPPGIGKTHLLRLWQAELQREGVAVLECRCLPETQGSALFPIVDLLRTRLQLRGQDPAAAAERLREFLISQSIDEQQAMPLLEAWLDLPRGPWPEPVFSPQKRRQLFLQLMADLVRSLSAGTAVLVVEDIQWADPTTLLFISELYKSLDAGSFSILCSVRTGAISSLENEVFPVETHSVQLENLLHARDTHLVLLGPLSPISAERLTATAMAKGTSSRARMDSILERAAGIPLFLLELARARESEEDELPASIAEVLRARIDQLGVVKGTAQLAAVIGPQFSVDLLTRLSLRGPDLLGDLSQLDAASILVRQTDGSYSFSHALVRESAYQSLPRRDRVRLHAAVANALEAGNDLSLSWLLAWHHHRAGNTEQALGYGISATGSALQRFDNLEALGYVRRMKGSLQAEAAAGWLVEMGDPTKRAEAELKLMSLEATAISLTRGWTDDELDVLCRRATELFELVPAEQTVPLRWALVQFYVNRGLAKDAFGNDRARVYIDELLEVATKVGAQPFVRLGRMVLGAWLLFHGEIEASLRELSQIDVTASEEPWKYGLDTYAIARSIECLGHWLSGEANVPKLSEHALQAADSVAHAGTIALAKLYQGALFHLMRDREGARKVCAELLEHCDRHGIQGYPGYAIIILGWADDQPDSGRAALEALSAAGQRLTEAYYGAMIAEAQLRSGAAGDALERLLLLERLAEDTGERFCVPEILFLQAQCLQALARPSDEVELKVVRALEVASAQRARGMVESLKRRYREELEGAGASPRSSHIRELVGASDADFLADEVAVVS